jgi:hypothetical protein
MRVLPVLLAVSLGIAVGVSLAACSSMPSVPGFDSKKSDVNVDPTVFPKNYKQDIIDSLPQLIRDIDGMQNPGVTDPALGPVGNAQVYFVCVRGNPHVASTGSLGDKVLIAYFLGGRINQLVQAGNDDNCAKAVYKPFPELANWCRGAACTARGKR